MLYLTNISEFLVSLLTFNYCMKFINDTFNEDINFIPIVEYTQHRESPFITNRSYDSLIDIKKNVTFNNKVTVILIPTHRSLNNISENKLWYNNDDYQCFKNEIINENRLNLVINDYKNYIEKINENIQDPLMF